MSHTAVSTATMEFHRRKTNIMDNGPILLLPSYSLFSAICLVPYLMKNPIYKMSNARRHVAECNAAVTAEAWLS